MQNKNKMKILVFIAFVAFAAAIKSNDKKTWPNHAYIRNVASNLGKEIRSVDKAPLLNRIIGGAPSEVLPYQVSHIIINEK